MTPPRSPKSPSTKLKFQFMRQNLWNDGFDPFMAALQNVTEDEEDNPIRARSNWPLQPICSARSIDFSGCKGSVSARWAMEEDANSGPNQSSRPIGLHSGSKVRHISRDQAILAGPTEKDGKQQMGSRRQRMKVFLRNASLKKERDQGVTVWKPQCERSSSIRSITAALCLGFGSKGKRNKKQCSQMVVPRIF